jgi:hypothetical protein
MAQQLAQALDTWEIAFVDGAGRFRELAHIGHLDALPKLLTLAASQTARLANLRTDSVWTLVMCRSRRAPFGPKAELAAAKFDTTKPPFTAARESGLD